MQSTGMRPFHLSHHLLLCLLLVILSTIFFQSCDPSFSPIKQDSRQYSVFGFFNAAADTQFIRIEQLRDSLFGDAPSKLDIEVKLTNETTGQSVMMKDSLFQFPKEGKAHNYYTTFAINPTETYRLEIIKEKTVASAEVTIPDTFPPPEVTESMLKITGIDRLIGVKTIYYTVANCVIGCSDEPGIHQHAFQHLADTLNRGNGVIYSSIGQQEDLSQISTRYSIHGFTTVKVEVVVAAGSPEWPDFISLDEEAAAIPGVASNIKDGVGLLGGVVTDTILIRKNEDYEL